MRMALLHKYVYFDLSVFFLITVGIDILVFLIDITLIQYVSSSGLTLFYSSETNFFVKGFSTSVMPFLFFLSLFE